MQPAHTRHHIAIVEDDQGARDAMAFLLEVAGYHVAKYASAQEFLSDYDPHRVIGLVLDQHMPGVTGLELAEHLRAAGRTLPILLVTARPSALLPARAAELGINNVLEKPSINEGLMAFCAQLDRRPGPS